MLEGETKIRKERIWYENAKYHVMARSIYGRPLFKTEDDYELFTIQVKNTKEKYPFDIHSYCLMTTHFHMLIEAIVLGAAGGHKKYRVSGTVNVKWTIYERNTNEI